MRFRTLSLLFCAACLGLLLFTQTAPLCATAAAELERAVTPHGAKLFLRLGELTFAFDRDLPPLLGDKWDALCAMSARLLPPGVGEAVHATAEAISGALGGLLR